MTRKKFEDNLLHIKKAKFLESVKRTAKQLGLEIPKVKIWEDQCPYGSSDEEAHIHPDLNIICVSLYKLKEMTYDDIEETASHEVNHLLDTQPETEHVHSPDFYRRHDEVKVATWQPPGAGLVYITNSHAKVEESKLQKKPNNRIDKVRCNYHLCRKKKELEKCKHCERYYCNEHTNPIEPTIGIGKLTLDELGHPCPNFVSFKERGKKEKDKTYGEVLAKLTRRKDNHYAPITRNTYREKSKMKTDLFVVLIIILIIILILRYLKTI